jgi:hypothetical protein
MRTQLRDLLARYQSKGHIVFVRPRKMTVSLDGHRDITFDEAVLKLQAWENSILDPIIDARGCSRDCARVHAGISL